MMVEQEYLAKLERVDEETKIKYYTEQDYEKYIISPSLIYYVQRNELEKKLLEMVSNDLSKTISENIKILQELKSIDLKIVTLIETNQNNNLLYLAVFKN